MPSKNNPTATYKAAEVKQKQIPGIVRKAKSFCFLLLPVYLYALSFEDYHQLSARLENMRRMKKMSQIRRDKERKKEVKMEKG